MGYGGMEKDGETNFTNFELRQYDPRLGRWFNPDPMGQFYSPYLAMGNNPISMTDPTGGASNEFNQDEYEANLRFDYGGAGWFGGEFSGNYQHGGGSGGSHTASGGFYSNSQMSYDAMKLYYTQNHIEGKTGHASATVGKPYKDEESGLYTQQTGYTWTSSFGSSYWGLVGPGGTDPYNVVTSDQFKRTVTKGMPFGDSRGMRIASGLMYGASDALNPIPSMKRAYFNDPSEDVQRAAYFYLYTFGILTDAGQDNLKAHIQNIDNMDDFAWSEVAGQVIAVVGSALIGEGVGVKSTPTTGEIPLTKSTFGHTFITHGENTTNFLLNRAKGSGAAQGQFLNNQAAAKFILENINKTTHGAVNIPVPKNFPARVIMPDGTFKAATHIRIIPSGNGVKTAYPLIL
jgi:RHS repeat-associated protein